MAATTDVPLTADTIVDLAASPASLAAGADFTLQNQTPGRWLLIGEFTSAPASSAAGGFYRVDPFDFHYGKMPLSGGGSIYIVMPDDDGLAVVGATD